MPDQPKLLTKDQLLEAMFYVLGGALVAIPGALATGFGIAGAVLIASTLLAICIIFIVAVNAVRRRRWRRSQRSSGRS
jgi:hypothetical protein